MKIKKFLLVAALASQPIVISNSLAITTVTPITPDKERTQSNEHTLQGKLHARNKNGDLITSVGTFKTVAGQVEDRRPIDNWYQNPANADVFLQFQGKSLIKAIIY